MKLLTHSRVIILEMAVLDFLLTFGVLMLFRGLVEGTFPRWYILAATAAVWTFFAILTRKLEFWHFATKGKALWTIVIVDVTIYILSYIGWKLMFPERGIIAAQLWPLPFIILIEIALYYIWNSLFKKVQYLYINIIDPPYHERGIEKAASYSSGEDKSEDFHRIYETTKVMGHLEARDWIRAHRSEFSSDTLIIDSRDGSELENCPGQIKLIISLVPFNDQRHFNRFLEKVNSLMADGGIIALQGETSGMRRHRITTAYPTGIGHIVAVADYLWSRVMAKLALTRGLYMFVTKGRNRSFPRVEVLGRITKAGFEVCGEEIRNDAYYVKAVRRTEPMKRKPYYGLFVRLPRKGMNGKMIGVFKLRTMYAYSEYIQEYTYRINGLEDGGKLKDDFRVNLVGSYCRSRFIDEFPMFINFFKRDLKLVGVRPLSNHYLSLYTPEMQALHLSVKPGIFPPLYYEYPKPVTIEEIQESERRYIESYREHPFKTDWTYFWGMMRNILFRRERSH